MTAREVITPAGGPFVADGPVRVGPAPGGRWSLSLVFTLGTARRARLLAHLGTPGTAPGWSFGLRGACPFLDVRSDRTLAVRSGPLATGVHLATLRGEDDAVRAVDLDGRRFDVHAAGPVLADGLGPFAPTHGIVLGGLRDRAGGHADLRFGLDDGEDLLRAILTTGWPEVRPDPGAVARRAPRRARGLETRSLVGAGDLGYAGFRVPGLARAPDGSLLAVVEGRCESLSDACPRKDLLVARSEDGGETWSVPTLAVAGAALFGGATGSAMNPSLLIDDVRAPGRTILAFTALDASEWEVEAGRASARLMRVDSHDGGRRWSAPRPLIDPRAVPADLGEVVPEWAGRAPAMRVPSLGHGVQWTSGPSRGRMALCGNATYSGQSLFDSVLHLLLSDDGGATWRFGATPARWGDGRPATGLNEASLAATPDGGLWASVRAYRDGVPTGRRALLRARLNRSGRLRWGPVHDDPELEAPAVHGSIASWTAPDGTQRLAVAHPHHRTERRALSLRIRRDDGPWSAAIPVRDGFSAYSDLAYLPDEDALAIAFERSLDGEIAVARLTDASQRAPQASAG
jgi:sialidase-1